MIFGRGRRMALSDAERRTLRETPACTHCGGWHAAACPRVRRVVFNSANAISEVEFWPWREWPKDHIVFPDELERSSPAVVDVVMDDPY